MLYVWTINTLQLNSVSILSTSVVRMHLNPDRTEAVECLKGTWRQKHRYFEVGNVYEHAVNLGFSDSCLPKLTK